MGKIWASTPGAFVWIGGQLWRWEVVAIGAPLIYAAGISAIYGDDYVAAGILLVSGIAWITAKALSWVETRGHPNRGAVSILFLILGIAVLAASLFWIRHRAAEIAVPEKAGQKAEAVVPTSPPPNNKENPLPPSTTVPGAKSENLAQPSFARHLLSGKEQKDFEAPLREQTEPKETIVLNCPANEESDCAFALQFVDYFRVAGFTVDGNMVHRITLQDPYYGVVLGAHVDKDADPNRPVGTGVWVQLTPTYANVVQAFVNIHTGTVAVSGSQVPKGSLEIYFGPERQLEDERNILQQSIEQAKRYKQAQMELAAMKKAKQNTPPPHQP